MYAFTNSHDVSWGTKGLSGQSGVAGGDAAAGQQLARRNVKDALKRRIVDEEELSNRDAIEQHEKIQQYYRTFSTKLILVWALSNLFLLYSLFQLQDVTFCTDRKPNGACQKGATKRVGEYYLQGLLLGLSAFRLFQVRAPGGPSLAPATGLGTHAAPGVCGKICGRLVVIFQLPQCLRVHYAP